MQPHHSRRMSSELVRKWLNISTRDSDFGADTDVEDDADVDTFYDPEDGVPRLRRQKSETFRAQYINKKELRICVGTWNVGGRVPPDDLDIDEWLNISEPSDIYVLGLRTHRGDWRGREQATEHKPTQIHSQFHTPKSPKQRMKGN
uniref:Inositol polyphosphate-related phosphatase domain-containing protein n=1 Tax=Opuntia streptacantha TaxID=393608 RepID=A0A7C9ACZ8_OPUST